MSGLVELVVAAVVSSGTIGAVAGHLTARRRARASESIATKIHDERVAPVLAERLELVEARLDARDAAIVTLRGQAADLEIVVLVVLQNLI